MPDSDSKSGQIDPKNLPSVFEAVPEDLGGIYARQGFAYQDDVAAGFYVQMLSDSNLSEVSCETYDDILLVWHGEGGKVLEFVQVKGEHPDQLWSVAKLCERSKSQKSPDGKGTSVLERSLVRDRYVETARFRIVTCRQVHADFEVLTREHGHEHRKMSYGPFKKLSEDVGRRLHGVRSVKKNGTDYWLRNAHWNVIAEADISRLNREALGTELHKSGLPYDPDTVRGIYGNLCALAKETAEYGVEKWTKKRISCVELLAKLRSWIEPYPDKGKADRLTQKLTDGGLDRICQNVAKDQQQFYLRKKRSPGYLTTKQIEVIEQQVLDKLHILRSSLDSGKIKEGGVEFHDRCLNEVNGLRDVNTGSSLLPGYLSGCMYEITARCRHRFTRFQA